MYCSFNPHFFLLGNSYILMSQKI